MQVLQLGIYILPSSKRDHEQELASLASASSASMALRMNVLPSSTRDHEQGFASLASASSASMALRMNVNKEVSYC